MDDLAVAALVHDKVVASWETLSVRPPSSRLTTAQRVDHLAPLSASLLRAVFADTPQRAHRAEMIRNAATHGEDRRAQEYDEEIILEEYYLIRELIWTELRARLEPSRAAPIIYPRRRRALPRFDRQLAGVVPGRARGVRTLAGCARRPRTPRSACGVTVLRWTAGESKLLRTLVKAHQASRNSTWDASIDFNASPEQSSLLPLRDQAYMISIAVST